MELCETIVSDHVTGTRLLHTRGETDGTSAGGATGGGVGGGGGGGGTTGQSSLAMSKLSGSYERMKRILNERVRWNRANGQARSVILWADLLLRLLQANVTTLGVGAGIRTGTGTGAGGSANATNMIDGTRVTNAFLPSETDELVIVQLQKVHALLELGETTAALKLAQLTVQQMQSTRTLVMAFLAGTPLSIIYPLY